MKKALIILSVFLIALCSCGTSETPEASGGENIPEELADYVEMLEALNLAFATGEYQEFIDAFPGPVKEALGLPGPVVNEWASLLEGVTAEMSYNTEEFIPSIDMGYYMKIHLNVQDGNTHLPNGTQTVNLHLRDNWEADNRPAILSMMLNTDGRQIFSRFGMQEIPSFEDKIFIVTGALAWANMPIERTINFLTVFEGEFRWGGSGYKDWSSFRGEPYTEDEIIAGAKKYLGMDYSPVGAYLWRADAPEGERTEFVWIDEDGQYSIVPIGIFPKSRSLIILDTPSEGDLTVRAFTYADYFLLEIEKIEDYNFLIKQNDDGTQYAQLLSVQTVE